MQKTLSTRARKKQRLGKLFVLPSCIIISLFVVYPLFHTLYLSFCDYKFGFDASPTFHGIRNYIDMFSDGRFLLALKNTLVIAGVDILLMMCLAMSIALLLFFKKKRTWAFRTAIFMPIVIPASLICILFRYMFSGSFGIINQFLIDGLNLPQLARNWLVEKDAASWVIIIVSLWNKVGFCTILYLAGLQGISQDILEAAEMDGATGWRKLIHIILPNLTETHIVAGIWTMLQLLKLFDTPLVLTGGGPADATLTMYMYIYKSAFNNFDMGYAAAMSFVFTIIIMVFALANMKLNSRKD